ncbi:MAG: hypothetical protein J6C11_02345 [Spirochaetaceae bacterium]|nr:hypothetical protein [Spirochaetaceae bacterium]
MMNNAVSSYTSAVSAVPTMVTGTKVLGRGALAFPSAMRWAGRLLVAAILTWLLTLPVVAEQMGSATFGFSLDLPEGFVATQAAADGRSYQFKHQFCPAEIIIRIYEPRRYQSAQAAMEDTLARLSAREQDISQVEWRQSDCSLASYRMNPYGNHEYGGWGVAVELPEQKGWFTMLSYAPTSDGRGNNPAHLLEQLVISVIDSLSIDRGSQFGTGPITAYAFPSIESQPVQLDIAGRTVQTEIGGDDIASQQFVIRREFDILVLYAETDLLIPAWQRYYRMVYRSAYQQLRRPAFDIYASIYDLDSVRTSENPRLALAQTVMDWVQTFPYERNFQDSDLSAPTAVLAGALGSDCDSRSILLAILLHHMNYQTVMFLSPAYQHAMLGVEVEATGAKMKVGDRTYMVGETTDQVAIGQVAASMSVEANWLPVTFP